MILYINTTSDNLIEIGIKDKNKFIYKKKLVSNRTQAEKLLPGIAKMFESHKLKLKDLKSIEVANRGGSFTSLRIGVITANALGYALAIPVQAENGEVKKTRSGELSFDLVKPEYSSEPNVTVKKSVNLRSCGKSVKN